MLIGCAPDCELNLIVINSWGKQDIKKSSQGLEILTLSDLKNLW